MQQPRQQQARRDQKGVAARREQRHLQDLRRTQQPLVRHDRREHQHGICQICDKTGEAFVALHIHDARLAAEKSGEQDRKQHDHLFKQRLNVHGFLRESMKMRSAKSANNLTSIISALSAFATSGKNSNAPMPRLPIKESLSNGVISALGI